MFVVPLLSKAFRSIAGAVTPSQQKVTRQKLEIPASAEQAFTDSFLGSSVIHYEILEHTPPLTGPVRPDHVVHDFHRHWLSGMPTADHP